MGALMTRAGIAAAYEAALQRKKRDRRQEYRGYSEAEELRARLDGRTLDKVSIYAPEFRDAESPAEWWDDRVLERGSQLNFRDAPETPVLVAVAAAARDGGGAAAAALGAAGQLEPRIQFAVYETLRLWRKHDDARRLGADVVLGRVLAEWERLELQAEDPGKPRPERRRRRWEITETEGAAS